MYLCQCLYTSVPRHTGTRSESIVVSFLPCGSRSPPNFLEITLQTLLTDGLSSLFVKFKVVCTQFYKKLAINHVYIVILVICDKSNSRYLMATICVHSKWSAESYVIQSPYLLADKTNICWHALLMTTTVFLVIGLALWITVGVLVSNPPNGSK